MSEFERAREKAERKLQKQVVEIGEHLKRPTLTLKTPKEKLKSNEIEVSVWANGQCYQFTYKAKITGSLMASQINEKSLRPIISKALSSQFGAVE